MTVVNARRRQLLTASVSVVYTVQGTSSATTLTSSLSSGTAAMTIVLQQSYPAASLTAPSVVNVANPTAAPVVSVIAPTSAPTAYAYQPTAYYLQLHPVVKINYDILVGNIHDGPASSSACSTIALLSTCNLRSAWALCMTLIHAVTCPSSARQALLVTCNVTLPSSSSIAFNSGHGGAMDLSAVSSWASTCDYALVSLSISTKTTASLPKAKTNITGDGTSTSLFYLDSIPLVRFSMRNVVVMGFGNGSTAFLGAIYLHSLLGASFGPDVQFGPHNVGYNTAGALVVYSLSSLHVWNSIFIGNSASVQAGPSFGAALFVISSNEVVISNSTFVHNSIHGAGFGGALFVLNSNNVTISRCTFSGNAIPGGTNKGHGGAICIYSCNIITVTSCSIANNTVTGGGGQGGAVAVYSSTNVVVTRCNILSNSVTGAAGLGGALLFASTIHVTVSDCTIVGNGIVGVSAVGGALYFESCSAVTVISCSISRNSITGDSGIGGSLIFYTSNAITISGCSISSNTVTGVGSEGAGLSFHDSGTINIIVCTFFNNTNHGLRSQGGVVHFASSDTISVTSCIYFNNGNTGGAGSGGAINSDSSNAINISNCTFTNNTNTGGSGGAIGFHTSNTISITNCRMFGNSVSGEAGFGGALFIDSSKMITITSCIFKGNLIGSGFGGALYLGSANQVSIAKCSFTSNLASNGGAIYIGSNSALIGMAAVHFIQNGALSGGAVYVAASCSYISFGGPMPSLETCVGVCDQAINTRHDGSGHSITIVQEPPSVHVVGYYVVFNDVPNNVLSYLGDGAIVGDYMYGTGLGDSFEAPGVNGAAPYLYRGSIMTINVTRNNVPGNAYINMWVFPFSALISVFDGNGAVTSGGAIYIDNTVSNIFVMPGTVFTGNTVAGNGGAMYLASLSNKMYFYSTVFTGNNALFDGGAVAFQNLVTSVLFSSCSFLFNNAEYGGAVYLSVGNGNDVTNNGLTVAITIVNSTIRHNSVTLDGGGIYADNINVFALLNTRMVDNVAGRSGGAVGMNTANSMSLSALTSFVHNSAGTDGGAISTNASNTITSLIESTIMFTKNTCMGRGGALAINAGTIITFNSDTTFESNYALHQGGAIAVSDSSLVLGSKTITFINNSAISGSAMYLTSSSTSSINLLSSYNGIIFQHNICRDGTQGGTVFIVKDPPKTSTVLFGPDKPNYERRVVFVNNTAGVGRGVATQTTSLQSTLNDTTIIVTDYNIFLRSSLAFKLVDAFNDVNTSDFATTVSILANTIQPLPCTNHYLLLL